jgi:uncharacterized protein with ATP-grasp and redox domains
MPDRYPPPIYSTEPGTWAHSTVSRRFPAIARRVLEENQYSPAISDDISRLIDEIGSGVIRNLQDHQAPDSSHWEGYIHPYSGQNWLEVPWFFAEHYFYRRIVEAVGYFTSGSDPFRHQKIQGLLDSDQEISVLADFIQERRGETSDRESALQDALYFSLWGNQADLSLWPAGSTGSPRHASHDLLQDHLLANDSDQLLPYLIGAGKPVQRVDVMLDNAGLELVIDLGLAALLLDRGVCSVVTLHAKAHPTFVSDAIPGDILETVAYLSGAATPEISKLGDLLAGHLSRGSLVVRPDFFWNSPLAMWELTGGLKAELGKAALLISKGDANYRRLLGDRVWDYSYPFDQAVDYRPAPLAALRTLKAELAVGLDPDQVQELFVRDPTWLVNGRWGVLQYAPGCSVG